MLKKSLSLLLAVIMATLLITPAFATGEGYTITNPYAAVDWDNWNAYKACLHAHTTFSDGTITLPESVERYYELDYDILAITDHGVLGAQWNEKAQTMPIISYYGFINKFDWLTDERFAEITAGTDRDGRGMLCVTQGIELNAVTIGKNHVNGFFCDYGYNDWGIENQYEPAVKGNSEAGGVTFLNHLGDWTRADGDPSINSDPETVQYFADILIKYPSCLGLEAINSKDGDTRNDRILWDNLVKVVASEGRNVFGFANDDSHDIDDIGHSFEVFMMPELTQDALRTSMETGAFFACGRRAIAELGDSFHADINATYPIVTRVDVDDDTDVISVTCKDYDKVEWVADGKVIAEGTSIDLNDYEDQISCFVRCQVKGEGGICFSQPFILDDGTLSEQDGTVFTPVEIDDVTIRNIVAVLLSLKNTKLWSLIDELMH